jgi:hypothetical protein
MMKSVFATACLVALMATSAHAQFSLKTFDGKVIANKNKPSSGIRGSGVYFLWEADHVRVQLEVTIGKLKTIDEVLVYYADADSKMPNLEKISGDNGQPACFGAEVKSKKGNSFPNYNWREDSYSQQMTNTAMVLFVTEADGKAFFTKLAQKCKEAKPPVKRIVLKKMTKEKK